MLTLLCNVKLTRRQEMCFVVDQRDALQWSGRDVYSALEYILDEGQTHFMIAAADCEKKLHLTIRRD